MINIKKIALFFLIIIIIIVGISYMYFNYKANYYTTKRENRKFETYENQEISGSELATIINRAVDSNESNEVLKDDKGKYINNDNNSIKIDIKFIDNDKTYTMEELYRGKISRFVEAYKEIKFKCTKLEYHKATNRVKYMFFEQITQ